MSKKTLPYEIDAKYDAISILKVRHEIPYHSRPFMWDKDNYISQVVNDIIKKCFDDELQWLGFVILYIGGTVPSISDAQHRLTICTLMVIALSRLIGNKEALTWISSYGNESILGSSIPDADKEILEKYDWERYPNIVSCYEQDFEALGNLINEIVPSDKTSSKIYSAFDVIYEAVSSVGDYTQLLRFIHNNIKVTRVTISDWGFTINLFGALNNIKVEVPPSCLLKNAFAKRIGIERSKEIHDKFRQLEKLHVKNYEQFVHNIMNLYAKSIMTSDEYARQINSIVDDPVSATDSFAHFVNITEQYNRIVEFIQSNPYGYILMTNLSRGHEIMSLCLIPFGYVALAMNQEMQFEMLLRLLVAYGIRQRKAVGFNALKFQQKLKPLMESLMQGHRSPADTLTIMKQYICEWIGKEDFQKLLYEEVFISKAGFQVARGMLLYAVLRTDTHESCINMTATQIDHISPKNPGKKSTPLENPALCYRIGNFTPFVGKNSANVKGNMGLGNSPFEQKVEHYLKSNIAMTRHVASNYTTFRDEQIIERSAELAKMLDELTMEDI